MKLKKFIDGEHLDKDLTLSESNLTEHFIEQAGLFAYYAKAAALAQHQCDKAKLNLELVTSTLDSAIRTELTEEKVKITEALIDNKIKVTSEYAEAQECYLNAKLVVALCKAAVDSMSQRKDMLVQVGAYSREEMKGSLRMVGSETQLDSINEKKARFLNK